MKKSKTGKGLQIINSKSKIRKLMIDNRKVITIFRE
jgi:hypothetical protein